MKSILEVVCESARELYEAGVMGQATFEQFQVRRNITSGQADVEASRVYTTEQVRLVI